MKFNNLTKNNNILRNIFVTFMLLVLGAFGGFGFLGTTQTAMANTQVPNVSIQNEGSSGGYLRKDWLSEIGLSKTSVTEIYFQANNPEGIESMSSKSVAAKDHLGTTYDSTTSDVTAYWTEIASGEYAVYIVCPDVLYAPQDSAEMFSGFTALTNITFNNFNTSLVKDMASMFYNCSSLTELDVTGFDTSNVEALTRMFYGCKKLSSIDLSNFNLANATNVNYLLSNTTRLNEVAAPYNVKEGLKIDLYNDFYNKLTKAGPIREINSDNDSDSATYKNTYVWGFEISVNLDGGEIDKEHETVYLFSQDEQTEIELGSPTKADNTFKNWTITQNTVPSSEIDGEKLIISAGATGDIEVAAVYQQHIGFLRRDWVSAITPKKNQIKAIYFQTTKPDNHESMTSKSVAAKNESNATFDGTTEDVVAYWQQDGLYYNVYVVCPYTIYAPSNSSNLFSDNYGSYFSKLQTISFGNLDTSKVTNMSYMFRGCNSLTSLDISGLDVSNVVNMQGTFALNIDKLDISCLDMTNIANVSNMLDGAIKELVLPYNVSQYPITLSNIYFDKTTLQGPFDEITEDCDSESTENPTTWILGYKVEYNLDGGESQENQSTYIYKEEQSVISLNQPSKEGHTFIKWEIESNTIPLSNVKGATLTIAAKAMGNLTVKATYSVNEFSITFNVDGGENLDNKTYLFNTEAQEIILPEPTKTGHTFKAWEFVSNTTPATTINENVLTIPAKVQGNIQLKAVYEVNTYTVTLDTNGGNNVGSYSYTFGIGANISLTSPRKTGYEFKNWEFVQNSNPESKVVGQILSIPTTATGDLELKAIYTANTYNIAFNTDGGEGIDSTTYTFSETAQEKALQNASKRGYEFSKWIFEANSIPEASIDGDKLTIPEMAQGGIVLKAVYSVCSYTITFNTDGGTQIQSQNYTFGTGTSVVLSTPTKTGYGFDKWVIETNTDPLSTINENILTVPTDAIGDIEIKATYIANTYDITFDTDGGSSLDTINYTFKESLQDISLPVPTKAGYSFDKWTIVSNTTPASSVDGQTLTVAANAIGNINLKVVYKANVYKIILNTDGGNTIEDKSYTFSTISQEITLPEAIKTGYSFDEWIIETNADPASQINGQTLSIAANSIGDIELKAVYTLNGYAINFDSDGGSELSSLGYDFSTSEQDVILTAPTKSGYDFDKWVFVENSTPASSVNANVLTVAANATGTIKLKATYTPAEYEIIFNTDGGDALEGLSYFYNTQNQEITLPEATKTGYAFKEWTIVTNTTPASSVNIKTLTVVANAIGAIELKATYTAKKYTINFNTDGGTFVAEERYTFSTEEQTFNLSTPTKDLHTFKEWVFETNTTPESVISENVLTIVANAYGDVTLKATYVPVEYSIIFDTDGGDAIENSAYSYNAESQTVTLPEATKYGHTFSEWIIVVNSNPASSVTGKTLTIAAGAKNAIKVKATYIVNEYKLKFDTDSEQTMPDNKYSFSTVEQYKNIPSSTKNGYDFKEWIIVVNSTPAATIEGNDLLIPANAIGDIEFKATYTPKVYNIHFDTNNGEEIESITYTFSTLAQATDLPTAIRIGHTFRSWAIVENTTPASRINGNTLNISSGAMGDITVKASYNVNSYIISFDANGGSAVGGKSYKFNTDAQTIEVSLSTKRGYKFERWEFEQNTTPESVIEGIYLTVSANAIGNIKLKAVFSKNEYAITYDTDGGYTLKGTTYVYNEEEQVIDLDTPTKIGHTFAEWIISQNSEPLSKIVDGQLLISATAVGEIVLKAVYTVNKYLITFDTNGGSVVENTEYEFNSTQDQIIVLEAPTKRGYTFKEWNFLANSAPISIIEDLTLTIVKGAVNDISLVAVYDINRYTIKLDTDGGDELENLNYIYSQSSQTISLPIASKRGHTFKEWTIEKNSDPVSELTGIGLVVASDATEEIWLKAVYTTNVYNITFNSNGGTAVTTLQYTFSTEAQTIDLEAPTKRGYTFRAWEFTQNTDSESVIDGLVLTVSANAIGQIQFKAAYIVNSYKIIFDTDGGNTVADAEYTYSDFSQVKNLTIPKKTGHTFKEWVIVINTEPESSVANITLSIPAASVGEIKLKAVYTLNSFRINFNVDGGDPLQTILYYFSSSDQDIELPVPTKNGNTFDYWAITTNTLPMSSVEGSVLTIPGEAAGNITLKANYKVNTYSITFDSNGGSEVENTTYTFRLLEQRFNLEKPTRYGYKFSEWSFVQNTVPESRAENDMLIIPANAVGDIKLKAVYIENVYTITFNTDEGEDIDPITYTYSFEQQEITIKMPEKNGFSFDKWIIFKNTDPASSIEEDKLIISARATGDIELKALYLINSYAIHINTDGGTNMPDVGYAFSGSVQRKTLATPEKRGHTFIGWVIETNSEPKTILQDNMLVIPVEAMGDITVKATYQVNTYNLIIDTDNGQLTQNMTYTYSTQEQTFTLQQPDKLGYTFLEWRFVENSNSASVIENGVLKITAMAVGNVSVRAHYEINSYSIAFDSNGGTTISNIKYTYSPYEQFKVLNKPSKSGHNFVGWSINQNSLIESMIVEDMLVIPANATGDIALVAYYEPYAYTIKLDSQGGTTLADKTYGYINEQQRIILPIPLKPDNKFTYWEIKQNSVPVSMLQDGALIVPANAIGEIVLYAHYKTSSYTISFDTNGGKDLVEQKYSISTDHQTIEIPQPYKPGYQFLNWEITQTVIQGCSVYNNILSIPANAEGDIYLKAVYLVETFEIAFDTKGAAPMGGTTYTKQNKQIKIRLATPIKAESTFNGWEITVNSSDESYIENGELVIPANAHGDILLTAFWTQKVHVTFVNESVDQNGLVLKNPPELKVYQMTFTIGGTYSELQELSAEGYIFEGWYLDKACTQRVESRTIVKTEKNHMLYAKWTKPSKEVTLGQIVAIVVIIMFALALIVVTYILIYQK